MASTDDMSSNLPPIDNSGQYYTISTNNTTNTLPNWYVPNIGTGGGGTITQTSLGAWPQPTVDQERLDAIEKKIDVLVELLTDLKDTLNLVTISLQYP